MDKSVLSSKLSDNGFLEKNGVSICISRLNFQSFILNDARLRAESCTTAEVFKMHCIFLVYIILFASPAHRLSPEALKIHIMFIIYLLLK